MTGTDSRTSAKCSGPEGFAVIAGGRRAVSA